MRVVSVNKTHTNTDASQSVYVFAFVFVYVHVVGLSVCLCGPSQRDAKTSSSRNKGCVFSETDPTGGGEAGE